MLSIIVKCSYNTIHDVLGFSYPASMDMKDNWLFNTEMIGEALGSSGHDTSTLSAPYAPQPAALGEKGMI